MSRWLMAMCLALTMSAFAQTEDAPASGEAPVDPCAVPPAAAGGAQEPGKEQDELGRLGADGLPCPPPKAPAGVVPKANPDENPQPEPPATGKAEDFEPDEEISEDYPVPLPSDI